MQTKVPRDVHSYSNPNQVRVKHVHLDLEVDFDREVLEGSATLDIDRFDADAPLILDTRDLVIKKVEASEGGQEFKTAAFETGPVDPVLGAPLRIALPSGARRVRIGYQTGPGATALQWLKPEQTAGGRHPFLYTQSQAIHARSWIPLQDTPAVRVTYSARIHTPRDLMAVMSADGNPTRNEQGLYQFKMPQPIPSYLIALGVGRLEFRSLGKRAGVYAEPPVVAQAAAEFEDTERMIEVVESLYGPYRWERYDLLVLPPSFPFGGMENPRLTFATPTILAGDKSLVSLVAHELAHSWSGNLVTNATWSDFWLNEGFTVYLENRIQEAVYGKERSEMELSLEVRELRAELASLPPRDQILHVDLTGRDPDDGFTQVPYVKGALFLKKIESLVGRQKFDKFLRSYFDHFSFQSITTEDFVRYLEENLLRENPKMAAHLDINQWLREPGILEDAALPYSDAFPKVEVSIRQYLSGEATATDIRQKNWTTQEWLHALESLPTELTAEQMRSLDQAFGFTKSQNSEIVFAWLRLAIRHNYQPAMPRLKQFLTEVGRRKFIKPLYEELVKAPGGRQKAERIFRRARAGYHPIAAKSIDEVLEKQAAVKR